MLANYSLLKWLRLLAVARCLTTGQRGRITAGKGFAELIKYDCSAQGGQRATTSFSWTVPTLRREATVFAPPALRFYFPAAQRLALPARAGLGGQSHQMPNPPLGAASLKVRRNARTCPVHAVLARFWIAKVLVFMPPLCKYALLYQAGLEDGLFQLQGHNEFAC